MMSDIYSSSGGGSSSGGSSSGGSSSGGDSGGDSSGDGGYSGSGIISQKSAIPISNYLTGLNHLQVLALLSNSEFAFTKDSQSIWLSDLFSRYEASSEYDIMSRISQLASEKKQFYKKVGTDSDLKRKTAYCHLSL